MMKLFSILSSFFLSFFCMAKEPSSLDLYKRMGTNGRTLVCFHGSGENAYAAQKLEPLGVQSTLIGFNLPDHGWKGEVSDSKKLTFGTFEELIPAFCVLKKEVLDKDLKAIDLYGFSAGGGALINLLATLHQTSYDTRLKKLGIGPEEKESLLKAIQNGIIILDTPLKSIEEIIAFRGPSASSLEALAKQYLDHDFRPIDSIRALEGLSLHIILHFQTADEILSNRDDALFIERLQKANHKGYTSLVMVDEGGHMATHLSLWEMYNQKVEGSNSMDIIQQPKKFFIGHPIRTSNAEGGVPSHWYACREMDLASLIPHRINDNILGIYTDYETDENGLFTHVVGYEVSSLEHIPEGMRALTIEPTTYAVFTASGPFPASMLKAWQSIWSASIQRSYTTDFEMYPSSHIVDPEPEIKIYIALKKQS